MILLLSDVGKKRFETRSEDLEREQQINQYFSLKNQVVVLEKRIKNLATQIGLDDAKISLIREKGHTKYQQLKTDQEKAEFRQQVSDALILLQAFSQGLQIAKNVEFEEASETRKKELRESDKLYIVQPRAKKDPEAKGLAAKCERQGEKYGINDFFGKLMAEVRALPNKK